MLSARTEMLFKNDPGRRVAAGSTGEVVLHANGNPVADVPEAKRA